MALRIASPTDLDAALGALPVFSSLQVVLFPAVRLSLRVTQPRYVELVDDALQSHRVLAVVQVGCGEDNRIGEPPVGAVAGVAIS